MLNNTITLDDVFFKALKAYNRTAKTETEKCSQLIKIIDRTECGVRGKSAAYCSTLAKQLDEEINVITNSSAPQASQGGFNF